MPAVFVKICGICTKEDLVQISALGPDALGFVFWKKSARYIDPEIVGEWKTPPGIRRVGVFVDPPETELLEITQTARLDVIQLHRIASDWAVDAQPFGQKEFWRALDPTEMQRFGFRFDRFLLDSYDPRTVGGTGKTCDWVRAHEIVQQLQTPVLLAGGLTPENVSEAIRQVQPAGVDVSSGVELAPGKKDIKKVAAFLAACRTDG